MAFWPGKGATLMISTANGSTVLAAAAQVVTFTPPQMTHPSVDVTHLGSSEREFLGTIPDFGTFAATIEYDPTNDTHARLLALVAGTTPEEYRMVMATTVNKLKFKGLLNNMNLTDVTVEDVWRASLDWKISGPVVFTTA